LTTRIETLEKEVAALQKRLGEEQKKHQREVQSLLDSKKHLQQELTVAESDVERLNTQLDEKTQALRNVENRYEQERKQTPVLVPPPTKTWEILKPIIFFITVIAVTLMAQNLCSKGRKRHQRDNLNLFDDHGLG
jgi:hypothetical protein